MSAPSMVTRTGDSLVIRSVVSGNQLYVEDGSGSAPMASHTTMAALNNVEDAVNPVDMLQGEERDLPQCKVKRNYACNLCNYFTQNPRQHLHHLRDVHKEKVKIYECKDCLYASRHFQKLARHMRIVHDKDDSGTANHISNNIKTTALRRPRKRSRRPMDEMYEEDYGNSPVFDDDNIDESTTTINNPTTTIIATDRETNQRSGKTLNSGKLKCSLCPFTTRHQGHLTRHERQDHIKTRFFRCVKCSYVTHIKARFTKHVKYHSMPMIKCDLCDFRTPYKWNLDRHNKNHNGHGAFKCCACNFTADIKQSLTVHEMNHHVPPVGQAAAAGLGVGRRRNKVGASDSNVTTLSNEHNELSPSSNIHHQISNTSRSNLQVMNASGGVNENRIVNNYDLVNNKISTNSSLAAKKKYRPIPNLIPIQNTSQGTLKLLSPKYINDQAILSPINLSQQDLNDLCAKSVNSSLRDFTSLFDDGNPLINDINRFKDVVEITAITNKNDQTSETKSLSPQTLALQKKNASFFDKLKEKLMTNALPGDGASLTCRGCGHTAKCLSEISTHQKTCGKCTDVSHEQLVTHFSSTRCQHCRQRCKSSADLLVHIQNCTKANNTKVSEEDNNSIEEHIKQEQPHPMENKVFVWNNLPENKISNEDHENSSTTDYSSNNDTIIAPVNGLDLTSSSKSTEIKPVDPTTTVQTPPLNPKPITHGTDIDLATNSNGKRVFKCPHCSFWATTASRFHVHIVGHLNKKPFECSLCSYRSNWRWDITKHIRLKSVRDVAHQKAKVLMTDETGRRNYSKYNKYLMQMKDTTEVDAETTVVTPEIEKLHTTSENKKMRTNNTILTQGNDAESIFTKLPPGIKVTRSKIAYDSELNNNESKIQQKQQTTDQNLVSNQQSFSSSSSPPTLPALNSITKKSLWKCKKCNFRDLDRQILLQHVKEHYIQQRIDKLVNENQQSQQINQQQQSAVIELSEDSGKHQQQATTVHVEETSIETNDIRDRAAVAAATADDDDDDEASVNSHGGGGHAPFRCGHCHQVSNWKHVIQRHCRLKHRGDIRVLIGETNTDKPETKVVSDDSPAQTDSLSAFHEHLDKYTPKSDPIYKCVECAFYVNNKAELLTHLSLHNISQPEIYIEKAMVGIPATNTTEPEIKKRYKCVSCPYVSNSKSQFYYHKQFHRPRGAQFKCTVCSYNVTRRHLLHQHLKIHGLNVNTVKSTSISEHENNSKTNLYSDIPLVWIQFELYFLKMYKCRHCPQTSPIRDAIKEHEQFHNSTDGEHKCPKCDFIAKQAELLVVHSKYHNDVYGSVHCLVDEDKSDEEQILQLNKISALLTPIEQLSPERRITKNESDDSIVNEKVIYFCDSCPARFLSEKEYKIHIKFHSSQFSNKCPCCNFTMQQQSYLQAHLKVHTEEYQEKSKILQTIYPIYENHKCPRTAILMDVPEIDGPAWIVVSMNSSSSSQSKQLNHQTEDETNSENIIPQKYYRCELCPTKFYKFPALKYHKKLHGSDNPYKCTICNYAAKTESTFIRHQSVHEQIDSDPEIVEPSNKMEQGSETQTIQPIVNSLSSEIPLYMDSQFGILMHGSPEFIYPTYVKNGRIKEKRYKCHKCPSAFEKREQYKTHLTLHGSQQKFRCKQCDYSVNNYANYVQHLRKHQMNADAQAAKLKSRQNSSTDEQSDENVNDTNNLNNKITNNTSDATPSTVAAPLKISVADRQALMILQQRRSKDSTKETDERKLYACPNCPYANSRRDSIDNHIKRHISIGGVTSNYTCTYCDYSVPQCHFLRDHVKQHFLPMKTNKLEMYMIYDKLQIWSQVPNKNTVDVENIKNNSSTDNNELNLVFADESDEIESYKPPLTDEINMKLDGIDDEEEEHIIINALTSEVIIVNNESNETKDIVNNINAME